METTRHFVTTVFVVHGNKSLLHNHKKLDLALPPGGHIDRDELPHESAKREVLEETGLDVTISPKDQDLIDSDHSRPIPQPHHTLLDDIVRTEGEPTHQHINYVYFASSGELDINPQGHDEVSSDEWHWITKDQFETELEPLDVDPLTRQLCLKAIEHIEDE